MEGWQIVLSLSLFAALLLSTSVLADYGTPTCDYSPQCTQYNYNSCPSCKRALYYTACDGGCDYSQWYSCQSYGTCTLGATRTTSSGCPTGQVINQVCSSSSCTWVNSGSCAYCGDKVCNNGETCSTCPTDCGACCGNGVLNSGEACDYTRSPTGCARGIPSQVLHLSI